MFEKLLKGRKNAYQRTPGNKKGSAEIEGRIGAIEARASHRENQGTPRNGSLTCRAAGCKRRYDGSLPDLSLSNSASSSPSLDKLSSRRMKPFPLYNDAVPYLTRSAEYFHGLMAPSFAEALAFCLPDVSGWVGTLSDI